MSKTSWPAVLLFLGAGIVAAFQVGKAPIALSDIRADFGAGLAQVAWVLSTFPMVGAVTGIAMGVLVSRVGARAMLPLGLAVIAAASLAGALAPALPWLLATRIAEGLGLLMVVIAAPSLITQVTHGDDRAKAFGMWGCFMPTGMALSMLAAPLLSGLGWRGLWLGMAALAGAYALAVTLRPGAAAVPAEPPRPLLPDLNGAPCYNKISLPTRRPQPVQPERAQPRLNGDGAYFGLVLAFLCSADCASAGFCAAAVAAASCISFHHAAGSGKGWLSTPSPAGAA